jgi:hypothetical protein
MFSTLRKHVRVSPAGMIATLALILAMSGGAYAASKYVITSTKQIKPSVLKSLQGKTGANGAPGPAGSAGAQGSQGPAGPAGPQGTQGGKGETGSQGTKGTTGAAGATGPKGSTGATGTTGYTETLPEGKTETGEWATYGAASGPGELRTGAISFTIPLKTAPEHSQVVRPETKETSHCPGGITKPEATAGYLCLFEGETFLHNKGAEGKENNIAENTSLLLRVAIDPSGTTGGSTTSGAELLFETGSAVKTGENVSSEGVWAVTAE